MATFKFGGLVERTLSMVTSGSTDILINTSPRLRDYTGSTNQIVRLPDATTMSKGMKFFLTNSSTGFVTIQDNGLNVVKIILAGSSVELTLLNNSTANGIWVKASPTDTAGAIKISALNIDWSLGNAFYKTITTNSVFTFSNATDGQIITVAVSATGAFTATWPVITWAGGSPPVQTANKTDVYEFKKVGSIIYGSVLQNFLGPQWPDGADGDLHIVNGQNLHISEGFTGNYNSITIDAGGTLTVDANAGNGWVMLGCVNNCVINGSIIARQDPALTPATFNATDPNGYAISYSVPAVIGGAGGADGSGAGGAGQSSGNGGAGGNSGAGGGTGGTHGLNGLGIYLLIKGNITGTGTINVSGTTGTAGTSGGSVTSCGQTGGGGGGGGGGGTGGKILIRALSGALSWSPTINIAFGGGGGGGGGGLGWVDEVNTSYQCPKACSWVPCDPTNSGSNGANGVNGTVGVYTLLNV
jgi:hypothetical protein